MKKDYADYILETMKRNYDKIAADFSSTRNYSWDELEEFTSRVKEGDRVLDIGCGNGRLLDLFAGKKINYTGLDNSAELVKEARRKYPAAGFVVGEALCLPFEKESFDAVFSVAVLHHIPSGDYRRKFMEEIRRVLVPGGLAVVTVWNLWRRPKGRKLWLNYTIEKLKGKSKLDWNDICYPWKNGPDRFFHLFRKRELAGLARKAGLRTEKCFFGGENGKNLILAAKK